MTRFFSKESRKKGFTLVEVLVAVAIIAILAALIIPNVASMQRTLRFRQMNDYAKEIFMAAQSNLVEQKAKGGLPAIQTAADKMQVPANSDQNAHFPAQDYSPDYYYTTNEGASVAFDMVLPKGSIEETLRSKRIMIEFNPYTGNVFSVFYSEGDTALTYDTVWRNSEEDVAKRKEVFMGYYEGSGLSGRQRDADKDPILRVNGDQEAFAELIIPVPDVYSGAAQTDFLDGLRVRVEVTGETPVGNSQTLGTFELDMGMGNLETVDGIPSVKYSALIDSLADKLSFAGMAKNNPNGGDDGRAISAITKSDDFRILPGDNVSLSAYIDFTPPKDGDAIRYDTVTIGGASPMFGSMQKVSSAAAGGRCYDIYISNGRHLQNLNALHPDIAKLVRNVYVSDRIFWNETAAYYTEVYNKSAGYTNSDDEEPGRGLPNFVPITNANLFMGGVSSAAKFYGGKNQILYLNVDSNAASIANKDCYVQNGVNNEKDLLGAGLFSSFDTVVESVSVVNPMIQGRTQNGSSYTGALVGDAGSSYIKDCNTYLDLGAKYFTQVSDYYVSGADYVGGLIGKASYEHPKNIAQAVDKNDSNGNVISWSFAAVPVKGFFSVNTGGGVQTNGGIGGLIGSAYGAHTYNCYSSCNLTVTGTSGAWAGGFVGYCKGTRYSNCFATGNINWEGGNKRMGSFVGCAEYYGPDEHTFFTSCYSAGEVRNDPYDNNKKNNNSNLSDNYGAFSGTLNTNNVTKPEWYHEASYFLNLRQNASIDEKAAMVIGYDNLTMLPLFQAQLDLTGFAPDEWVNADAKTCHPYTITNSIFPFSKLVQLDYYGDWLTFRPTAGIAYYEVYSKEPSGNYNKHSDFGYYAVDGDITTIKKDGDKKDDDKKDDDNQEKEHSLDRRDQTIYGDGYAFYINKDNKTSGVPGGLNNSSVTINGKHVDDILYEVKPQDKNTFYIINTVPVYIYRLNTKAIMDAIDKGIIPVNPDEFYLEVYFEINLKNNRVIKFTGYFNPDFAMTQSNAIVLDDTVVGSATPSDYPNPILVRTPRHLLQLSKYDRYWQSKTGAPLTYAQSEDIDMNVYDWDYFTPYGKTAPEFKVIGTDTTPFQAHYYGTLTKPLSQIQNVKRDSDGKVTGIFGTIGDQGNVEDLCLIDSNVTLKDAEAGGLLAGRNNGRIANIDQVHDKGTISVKGNVDVLGLLVGENNGTVENIHRVYEQSVSVGQVGTLGLVAGKNTGTITETEQTGDLKQTITVTGDSIGTMGMLVGDNSGTLDNCNVTITNYDATSNSLHLTASEAAGALAGKHSGNIKNCTVSFNRVEFDGTEDGYYGGVAGICDGGSVESFSKLYFGVVEGHGTTGGIFGKLSGSTISNLSYEAPKIQNKHGISAGFAGEVENATVTGLTVTTGDVTSGRDGASGVFGTYTDLTAQNVTAKLIGTIGHAEENGGELDKYAAGMFLTGTNLTASNCYVYREENASIVGKQAAGFATQINGNATSCGVATGTSKSGLQSLEAIRILTDTKPKDADMEYYAAGFANEVTGEVSNCFAMGTLGKQTSDNGIIAAGFVNVNNGTLSKNMANINFDTADSTNCVGFVNDNSDSVDTSYVWHSGTLQYAFVKTNTGVITNSYAARLSGGSVSFGPDSDYPTCYRVDKEEESDGGMNISYQELGMMKPEDLGGNWTASGRAYPISGGLGTFPYAYAGVDHYGDWKKADEHLGGVFYYEQYEDGTKAYQILQLTGEGSLKSDALENKPISETGYGVFCVTKNQFTEIMQGDAPVLDSLTEISDLEWAKDLKVYRLEDAGTVTIRTRDGKSITFNTDFANDQNRADNAPHLVRTAKQLENMKLDPSAKYVVDLATVGTDWLGATVDAGDSIITGHRDGHGALNLTADGIYSLGDAKNTIYAVAPAGNISFVNGELVRVDLYTLTNAATDAEGTEYNVYTYSGEGYQILKAKLPVLESFVPAVEETKEEEISEASLEDALAVPEKTAEAVSQQNDVITTPPAEPEGSEPSQS